MGAIAVDDRDFQVQAERRLRYRFPHDATAPREHPIRCFSSVSLSRVQPAMFCKVCHFTISTLRRLGMRITPLFFSRDKARETVSIVSPR